LPRSSPLAGPAFDVTADAETTLEANPEDRHAGASFRVSRRRASIVSATAFSRSATTSCSGSAACTPASRAGEAFAMGARGRIRQHLARSDDVAAAAVHPQWLESVDGLIGLGPEHASLYILELYPNAPLRETMARSKVVAGSDDDAAEMYLEAMTRLDHAGYAQYEISNRRQARPGIARHNLKYWSDGEWLGFGCGAHSTRRAVRWKKPVVDQPSTLPRWQPAVSSKSSAGSCPGTEALEEALFRASGSPGAST
jgi:oxygen-independent coproporphyrinogen-3 oxidase